MASISPQQFMTEFGEPLVVRTATTDDAAATLTHARDVFSDDRFSITEPDEMTTTEQQQREWIQCHLDDPGKLALAAEISGELVGILFFENGVRRRLTHRGSFYMSVARPYRGRRVGTALLATLMVWARTNPLIEKIALSVLSANTPAACLYRKMGFVEEGRRRHEVKIAPGEYADDILMYRFV